MLKFSNQALLTTSPTVFAKVTNTGSTPITISAATSSGDFAKSTSCKGSLTVGASCNVSVNFTPTALGKRFGTVTLTDSDPTSPQVLPLTGVGTEVSISPSSLSFGNQSVGTTSNPQTLTFRNTGSSNINVTNVLVLGSYGQAILFNFSQTNNCIGSLSPGSSCSLSVTFTPETAGPIVATLEIVHSDPDGPLLVPLSGAGVGGAFGKLDLSAPHPVARAVP